MFDLVPFRRNNNSLSRGDYFDEFMNNFFGDDFLAPVGFTGMGNGFKVDLKENEDSYMIEADLPGVNKDSINVEYKDNYLTVGSKREDNFEDNKDNYLRRERRYGEFKRCFYIDNVKEDQIKASFKDGVLKINLPKSEPGVNKSRKINIE
ncbi:heat shock protein Hsp18 [Clostridium sp. JN-9]|uniref:heat shock protein Hsp18 n=1 Tax=Clostridium sp. JN-9 TaxID=2507159 RepID=UPI000FFE1EB3|nr:heat shock protein Hsp18 [Clostridium sp. JN-9]QAT41533.1 Hsp20/alpha crystallin family protein [Clostridium sp. JN-9]